MLFVVQLSSNQNDILTAIKWITYAKIASDFYNC